MPAGPTAGPPDSPDHPDEPQSEQDGGSDHPSDPATGESDHYEPL